MRILAAEELFQFLDFALGGIHILLRSSRISRFQGRLRFVEVRFHPLPRSNDIASQVQSLIWACCCCNVSRVPLIEFARVSSSMSDSPSSRRAVAVALPSSFPAALQLWFSSRRRWILPPLGNGAGADQVRSDHSADAVTVFSGCCLRISTGLGCVLGCRNR